MENKFFLDTENEFYECEDSAEFAKNKSQKKDSESNENRQPPSLAKEFYKDSAKAPSGRTGTYRGCLSGLHLKKLALRGEERQNFADLLISEAEANSIIQAICFSSAACGA